MKNKENMQSLATLGILFGGLFLGALIKEYEYYSKFNKKSYLTDFERKAFLKLRRRCSLSCFSIGFIDTVWDFSFYQYLNKDAIWKSDNEWFNYDRLKCDCFSHEMCDWRMWNDRISGQRRKYKSFMKRIFINDKNYTEWKHF